jgi:AcrR family transcriptional regulator
VPRPINKRRPAELEDAIVRYLIRHGIASLSLRPLAKDVGCSPRVLLYYFGSKEKMVVKAIEAIRRHQRIAFAKIQEETYLNACRKVWKEMRAPASEPLFRLYFEAYGLALRHPRRYQAFLRATIQDWLDLIAADLRSEGLKLQNAHIFASVILAGLRGFMLDYCATHDRRRIDRAVDLWLSALSQNLPGR